MEDKNDLNQDPGNGSVFQITVKGHLGSQWSEWFEGMTISLEENGETTITGPVIDQPALHGLLKKVRDLGLPLISVNQVKPDQSDTCDSEQEDS